MAIRIQDNKFKELAPELRYKVYDSYLKSQGIASGMLNYDEVLMLVRAWRIARTSDFNRLKRRGH